MYMHLLLPDRYQPALWINLMRNPVQWYSDMTSVTGVTRAPTMFEGGTDLEVDVEMEEPPTLFGVKEIYRLLEYPTLEMFSLLKNSFVRFQATEEYKHLLEKA